MEKGEKMRKQILIFITIISCMIVCASCSVKSSEHKNNTGKSSEKETDTDITKDTDTKEKESETDTTEADSSDNEVSGEMNQCMAAINEYFKNNDNWSYSDWILISFPVIYYIDKSDETDIKVYGNFWGERYTLYENRLINQGGGENPGICHIKKEDNNYSMVSFEESGDGVYLEESMLDFESKINITLNPTFYEWYTDIDIWKESIKNVQNVVLYKYTVENGLDCSAYMDYAHNIISIPKIKKVKYNNIIYTDTGQVLYYLPDDTGDFEIENVTDDIDNCLESDASDFEKCTIKTNIGDNQVGVKIDGRWHVFEK